VHPRLVIIGLWAAWAISWLTAAVWMDPAQKRVGLRAELPYRLTMWLGMAVLFVPAHGYEGVLRLWHIGLAGAWICIALIALGIAFAWWARIHLGRLWSGEITVKADHRIVDTGPYAIVRHPIYTGLLLSIFATAAAKGTILGLAGAGLLLLGIWLKAQIEERWLAGELGSVYDAYRRRVPMLVPFGPKAS
jgi:protein-S-isoprenylcysteine O-methyltransferase Ste14